MTQTEIENFFRCLDGALNELPYRRMPVDIDGQVHYLQKTSAWIIPADLAGLLTHASHIKRLEAAAVSAHCQAVHKHDGSIEIVWNPN
jgi:hypothetical protein